MVERFPVSLAVPYNDIPSELSPKTGGIRGRTIICALLTTVEGAATAAGMRFSMLAREVSS